MIISLLIHSLRGGDLHYYVTNIYQSVEAQVHIDIIVVKVYLKIFCGWIQRYLKNDQLVKRTENFNPRTRTVQEAESKSTPAKQWTVFPQLFVYRQHDL